MTLFQLIAVLFTLAAVFGYINAHLLGMPVNIGVMAISLVFSIALLGLQAIGATGLIGWAEETARTVQFDQAVLNGMLSVILFTEALHVDLDSLFRQGGTIGLLATVGVAVTAALVGVGVYGVQALLGLQLPFIYCLVFGALIAPTDPIAMLFVKEVLGGLGLGLAIGFISYWLLRSLNGYTVEVLITLAVVSGGYALALYWHFSGPLTVVAAGLLIGNHGRRFAVSDETEEHLDTFWDLMDELVNIVLFLLIGLEVLQIGFGASDLLAGLLAIPLVLLVRLVTVSGIVYPLSLRRPHARGTVPMLTWAGLRGGISVALALSLPASPERDLIVGMTYVVVVFSVLVQGLTVRPLVRRVFNR